MRTWLPETWDRIVASDPGLSRLRMATGGAFSMITALGVELAAAKWYGAAGMQTVLFLLMGGMVAMMGSMALAGLGPGVWIKVRTAAFFPVAFGVGMACGAVTHHNTVFDLAFFVVMTFAAVFLRRFGIPFFFYGFMSWIGYLFASLLGATFEILPMVLLALAIGTAWVLLLSLTALRVNTSRTLTRTLQGFHARVRTIIAVCADLADIEPDDERALRRWRVRLDRHQRRLSEAALMIEAASGEHEALPDAEAGRRLRNYALDAQLATDALVGSIKAIATLHPDRAGQAALVAMRLARRDPAGAQRATERLRQEVRDSASAATDEWWPTYRLTEAVAAFGRLAAGQTQQARLSENLSHPHKGRDGRAGYEASEAFHPAVGLRMGNLPSLAPLAKDVAPRGPRWLLRRLSMTTRQAIQVAVAAGLAIIAGDALSSHRYYWALIAVFVTFTGTTTRADSVRKALYRLLGTLTGLVLAMLLAHATAGNTTLVLVVIVASLFCGFYLIRVSYAFMIFFITIMVAQLYTVLGEYSNALLVLRLEETAIGAGIGIVVALAFLPLSTRDTIRVARDRALDTLIEVLETIADRLDMTPRATEAAAEGANLSLAEDRRAQDEHENRPMLEGHENPPTLEELARRLDNDVRQLVAVSTPFSRPAMWGNNGRHRRYRLTRYMAIAESVRVITVALRQATGANEAALVATCRSIAEAAATLRTGPAVQQKGGPETGAGGTPDIDRTQTAVASTGDGASRPREQTSPMPAPRHDALGRSLLRIQALLAEIAPVGPS